MPVEVYPIVAITAFAVGGATWFLIRLGRHPEVIWDKKVRAWIICLLTKEQPDAVEQH